MHLTYKEQGGVKFESSLYFFALLLSNKDAFCCFRDASLKNENPSLSFLAERLGA